MRNYHQSKGAKVSKNKFVRNTCIILIAFFVFIISLVIGIWFVAIPEDAIKSAVENSIEDPLKINIEGIKKGLFYNLNAESLVLSKNERELVRAEDISVKINPFYFFALRHKSTISGRIGQGFLAGRLDLRRGAAAIDIKVDKTGLDNIPYMTAIGLKGKGFISADINFKNNSGNIKFSINDARLESFSFSGIPVPLEMFNEARGLIAIKGNEVNIVSLNLEGKEIRGRIKGFVRKGIADLSIEIMPDASKIESLPILVLIERYRVSPGYYVIPVKTRIAF